MAGHIHAKLMTEYAKDAATHDEPWKLWEIQCRTGSKRWVDATSNPLWRADMNYRRKPEQPDLEKYGVEVGDVWAFGQNGDCFVLSITGNTCRIVSHLDASEFRLSTDSLDNLKFRRGVVNKL